MAESVAVIGIGLHLRPVLVVVIGLLLAERGLELIVDARHRSRLAHQGAIGHRPDGFGGILAAQATLFLLPVIETLSAPWNGGLGPWTVIGLSLLILAQVIRYWVIRTLGDRWTLRVMTVPGAPRIQRGPYRWLPHPNYAAVLLESIALPLAFGAWAALIVLPSLHLIVLGRRIRYEETALGQATTAT